MLIEGTVHEFTSSGTFYKGARHIEIRKALRIRAHAGNHRLRVFCLLNLHFSTCFRLEYQVHRQGCMWASGIEMTQSVLRKHWIVSLVLCLLVAITPIATADTVQLTANNMGIYRSVEAVTLTQRYSNEIQANVSMNRQYSLELQDGRFGFYFGLPRQLRPRHNHWQRQNLHGSSTGLSFQYLNTARNISQLGRFSLDLANLSGSKRAMTGEDRFSHAIISPGPAIDLVHGESNAFVRNVCAGGGGNCEHSREFSFDARRPTAVPETANFTFLGTALLAAAGIMRRHFQ